MDVQNVQTNNTKPEFFRIPQHGTDPYFGLSKQKYYRLDAAGTVKLVRLRERGKKRGTTLVPYDQTAAYIHSQAAEEGVKQAVAS